MDIQEIALELVPKELDQLTENSAQLIEKYPAITKINIPEIRSIAIKSFEASLHLLNNNIEVVPHFRTIDRDVDTMGKMLEELQNAGLKEVLFITGDPPNEANFVSSTITPVQMVKELKASFPALKFFAGMDPYRQSMKAELQYVQEKLDAGFDGLFTQPFFEPDLLAIWLRQLGDLETYVGISPVTSQGSVQYWENVNQVVFPPDFRTDLEYNRETGNRLLDVAAAFGQKAYLMPITISAQKYLANLF